jgi:hypothetical protein
MLERLGDTPEAVAETLRAAGVTGVRNTVRILNPVVRYALAATAGVREMDLISGDRLRTVFATGVVTEEVVPAAVLAFLDSFHRGEYPDLEMPTEPG